MTWRWTPTPPLPGWKPNSPPTSDYERDDRESEKIIETLDRLIKEQQQKKTKD